MRKSGLMIGFLLLAVGARGDDELLKDQRAQGGCLVFFGEEPYVTAPHIAPAGSFERVEVSNGMKESLRFTLLWPAGQNRLGQESELLEPGKSLSARTDGPVDLYLIVQDPGCTLLPRHGNLASQTEDGSRAPAISGQSPAGAGGALESVFAREGGQLMTTRRELLAAALIPFSAAVARALPKGEGKPLQVVYYYLPG